MHDIKASRPGRVMSWAVVLVWAVAGALSQAGDAPPAAGPYFYTPHFRLPATLEPFLRHIEPGGDAFPEEKTAAEISERLDVLSRLLRQGPVPSQHVGTELLAPEFKGNAATSTEAASVGNGDHLEILRSRGASHDPRTLGAGFEAIRVAEFLITAIEVKPGPVPTARTDVRYDLVGTAPKTWRAERTGHWRMDWRKAADGVWRVSEWTELDEVRSSAAAPVFSEVTQAALGPNASFERQLSSGLDSTLAMIDSVFMLDSMGHNGVSVGDADGDGLDDLYVAQPAGLPNRLFRNKGDGTFEDVTESAGLAVLDDTTESLFADVDNDGDQDLIMVTRTGLLLFLNDGKGHFTRVPDAFQFNQLRGSPMSIAMADYDRDGFLDIYLCTYSYFIGASEDKGGTPSPYHDAVNGPPDVLLRNDGHGHFVDVTVEAGLVDNNDRFSFAASWADYDGDGWPDLLVSNDFGRKNLFHNEGLKDGKVTFKDVAAQAGVEDHGAGMSATWVDYDNDGRPDIYTGNMWSAAGQRVTSEPGFMPDVPADIRALYRRHARGNSLFRNRGDGTFEDVTQKAGAEFGRWAWSSDAVDFDNDGWEDLYVVNGMFTRDTPQGAADLDGFFWRQVVARSPLTRITGTPYDDAWRAINRVLANRSQANHQRNVFLRNDGHGHFDEVSGSVGLDLDQDGRSFAVVDYDMDGDPDLVVMAPRSSPQIRIFRNDYAEKNAALAIRLTGTRSNRDGVGARVTVETDVLRRTKTVQIGSGFISQHSKELLFGLGKSQRILKVTIQWPSGATQALTDVPLGHRIWVEEGRAEPTRSEAFRSAPALAVDAAPPTRQPPASTNWLYEPYPAPDFTLTDLGGEKRSLAALRGRPALLLLWASSAPPSQAALRELGAHRDEIARAGASILTVALDSSGDAAKARAMAQGLPGLPVVIGGDDVGGAYALLNRYLFVGKDELHLPTAFLLNGEGEIVKVYRDHIDAAQILADLPRMAASPAERLARAVPFAGTFHSAGPGSRNYLQYALELVEQGLDEAALPAFERAAKGDPSAFNLYSLGTLYMKKGQPDRAQAAFQRALQVKPDFAEASNGLGALVAQGGNVPAAIALFRAAIDATPDYPDALNNLGYALLQTGRDAEAYDLFQKALALQPDFAEAFNNLGIYFGRQGEFERAVSFFKQAVEKRSGYGEAANNLGLVLAASGDTAGAVAGLKAFLEKNPGFEPAYVTLARIYANDNREREAIQVLQALLQRNPTHPQGIEMLKDLKGQR